MEKTKMPSLILKVLFGIFFLASIGYMAFLAWHDIGGASHEKEFEYDHELFVEKKLPGGATCRINNTIASFLLDVEKPDRHCNRIFKSHGDALKYAREAGLAVIPSVHLVQGKLKTFDDGFCAALETAVQNGIPGTAFPGKQETLARLLDKLSSLLSRVPKEKEKPVRAAVVHVATALTLGGAEPDLDPDISASVGKATDSFIRNFPMESKPAGFWTWNERLQSVFRQDRYLSQGFGIERDTPVCVVLSASIAEDERLAEAFDKFREFHAKLTNPPVYVDPFLAPAPQAKCLSVGEIMAFLPRGISTVDAIDPGIIKNARIEMQKRYGKHAGFALVAYSKSKEYGVLHETGFSARSDIVGMTIRAVRDGSLVLDTGPDSGWYDYQWHAMETLLLPEKARESQKLGLSEEYKKRLENAFKTSLAKHRETHIKNLPVITAGSRLGSGDFPKVEIGPEFSAEPVATVYLRYARAYRFLRNAMHAVTGDEYLGKLCRINADGLPVEENLDSELRKMALLCYGIYDLLAPEIGMRTNYLPGEIEARDLETAKTVASDWLSSLAEDPDLWKDARFSVPVAQTECCGKHFAVAGVRLERVRYEYGEEPAVFGPVEEKLVPTRYYLPTDLFFEFGRDSTEPYSREEFIGICDSCPDIESLFRAFGVTEAKHGRDGFSTYPIWAAILILIAAPVFLLRKKIRKVGFKRIAKFALPLFVSGLAVFFCVLWLFPGFQAKFLIKYAARVSDNYALMIERHLVFATSGPALYAIRDMLADPDPQVRYFSARILFMMTEVSDGPDHIPGLEQGLRGAADDPVPEVSMYAIGALRVFGNEENAGFLISKLDEKQHIDNICMHALYSLGKTGDPRAFDRIVGFIDDPRPRIRMRAVRSLYGCKPLTGDQIRRLYDRTLETFKPDYYATAVHSAYHLGRIVEETAGGDHPETAAAIDFAAILHSALRCFQSAERLHSEALEIREKAFGPEHPAVMANIRTFARFLASVGKHAEAEKLYKKVLGVIGPNPPETANILTSLGALHISGMRIDKAETVLNEALPAMEKNNTGPADCCNPKAMLEKIRSNRNGPFYSDPEADLKCLSLLYDRFLDKGRAWQMFEKFLDINKNRYSIRNYDIRGAVEKLGERDCPDFFKTDIRAEQLYGKKGLHIQVGGLHPVPRNDRTKPVTGNNSTCRIQCANHECSQSWPRMKTKFARSRVKASVARRLPTDPDVRISLIRFLGFNPFHRIENQTGFPRFKYQFSIGEFDQCCRINTNPKMHEK